MRTPEQIENLRTVLVSLVGSVALFMTEMEIDEWANRLQGQIEEMGTPHFWSIKIRLSEHENKSWDLINPEPKTPFVSFSVISMKCLHLLDKYPDIIEIQVDKKVGTNRTFVFNREEKRPIAGKTYALIEGE